MAEMKALLSFMDAEDRMKIMHRYERSFDAVGRDGEAALIREMGSPVRQVLMVEREYRERQEAGLAGVNDDEYVEEISASVIIPAEDPENEPVDEVTTDHYAELLHCWNDSLNETQTPAEYPCVDEEPEDSAERVPSDAIAEVEAETEYDDENDVDVGDEAPGAGRVIGAVALTPLMIILAVVGVALTVSLTAIAVVPGLALGAAAMYLSLYAFNSMSFLPDIILVSGIAVVAVALCIFFLWLSIWLLITGIRMTVRLISGVYGRVLQKGGADNE